MTSILKNTPNILDAGEYCIGGTLIAGNEYNQGHAIKAFDPNMILMDTKEIKAGTFGGSYSIGFYYDSGSATVQGTPLMRIEIYEDGVLMEEDTTWYDVGLYQYEYDLNYVEHVHQYGLFINKTLDPNKSHRLIIKTSPELSHDVILDYVIFEKIPSTGTIDGKPVAAWTGGRNIGRSRDISTYGTQFTEEVIVAELKGSFSVGAGASYGWSYNAPFKTISGVYVTLLDGNGQLTCNWADWRPEDGQVDIYIRNNSSFTWTSASVATSAWNYSNVRILVKGYV